jgi:hypothetical protein
LHRIIIPAKLLWLRVQEEQNDAYDPNIAILKECLSIFVSSGIRHFFIYILSNLTTATSKEMFQAYLSKTSEKK